ncbi:ribosomal protein L17 [Microthyrium microscopicum]|uniref:Large ribosomal subunit protein bL17m n=1 Tax=Microthyrium microscopicum TaxID=703497 RepID=A0A6A6URA0_9PEZI|nr:ribosomal protein L17 [Microthyrium microscopicum]
MAGAKPKYRHLSRNSAHRQALLRNLIDKLFEREHITTTWPKAKEAQKLAEKVITMGIRGTDDDKRKAKSLLYRPFLLLPKIFGPLAKRYSTRARGYTRVMRIEPEKEDQAPSAILELVDGPRDMKFHLTAKTLAYRMKKRLPLNDLTKLNVKKVTQFRENGAAELQGLVERFQNMSTPSELPEKKRVYPDPMVSHSRNMRKQERLEDFKKFKYWSY